MVLLVECTAKGSLYDVASQYKEDKVALEAMIVNPETPTHERSSLFQEVYECTAMQDAEQRALDEIVHKYKKTIQQRVWRFPLEKKCSTKSKDLKVKRMGNMEDGIVIKIIMVVVPEELWTKAVKAEDAKKPPAM